MDPRIEIIPEKKLIGKRLRMSLSNNKTYDLWHSFMPNRKDIKNSLTSDLFSMQVYDKSLDFKDFNPDTEFEKWAAIEVSDFNEIPDDMEAYTLKGGLYAVFIHKGAANTFPKTFQFIFNSWLPSSDYELDNREHFEILGDKYKNDDPGSEEEVWIPIRPK
ncbi:MAG: GyrI-like domain-containing protein [Bacteroidota bacterium]|nr:GyrI-like domain-containing protein [Bacteroidota bacterium]MDP4206540.1 GyrI-like domain-containing protein [Bacteroidota bacterium]